MDRFSLKCLLNLLSTKIQFPLISFCSFIPTQHHIYIQSILKLNTPLNLIPLQMNPQQSMQQYHQNLIQNHDPSLITQSDTHKQLIENFKKLNRSIQQRLQHFCKLTNFYIEKVETSFLVTFSKVLEKMGNDLMLAEEAYKNINKQIMEKQRCVNLNQDKLFFIQESNYYKQQLQFKSKEADKLKEKNFLLIKENTGLKEKLFEKVQEIMSLKQRCKKLQKGQLQNQSQVAKQLNSQEIKKSGSPQKATTNNTNSKPLNSIDKSQREWASLGKQTEQQKRRKEQQQSKEKAKFFTSIRKQLKTRQRINLDSIINRSFVEIPDRQATNHQFRSRKKRVHLDLLEGSKTMRLADVVQKSEEVKGKEGFGSTVATQFEMTFNATLMGKRSLHTSGERNGRLLKV